MVLGSESLKPRGLESRELQFGVGRGDCQDPGSVHKEPVLTLHSEEPGCKATPALVPSPDPFSWSLGLGSSECVRGLGEPFTNSFTQSNCQGLVPTRIPWILRIKKGPGVQLRRWLSYDGQVCKQIAAVCCGTCIDAGTCRALCMGIC